MLVCNALHIPIFLNLAVLVTYLVPNDGSISSVDNGGISSVNGIVVSFTNNVVVSSNDVGDAGDGGGDNTKKNQIT